MSIASRPSSRAKNLLTISSRRDSDFAEYEAANKIAKVPLPGRPQSHCPYALE